MKFSQNIFMGLLIATSFSINMQACQDSDVSAEQQLIDVSSTYLKCARDVASDEKKINSKLQTCRREFIATASQTLHLAVYEHGHCISNRFDKNIFSQCDGPFIATVLREAALADKSAR
ncbi:MAG TPA: hypothetical protein VJJ81_03560 [Candidatus Babeliales bacterium]|nr:hypothetical protein [Candidatus Babeliales bacterium]